MVAWLLQDPSSAVAINFVSPYPTALIIHLLSLILSIIATSLFSMLQDKFLIEISPVLGNLITVIFCY